ncbi:hypothetical protein PAMP_010648 [Pampus punctatissimus]
MASYYVTLHAGSHRSCHSSCMKTRHTTLPGDGVTAKQLLTKHQVRCLKGKHIVKEGSHSNLQCQPDDNILMTSPLIHHLTGWNAASVIARPLIVIGDCGGMLIMSWNRTQCPVHSEEEKHLKDPSKGAAHKLGSVGRCKLLYFDGNYREISICSSLQAGLLPLMRRYQTVDGEQRTCCSSIKLAFLRASGCGERNEERYHPYVYASFSISQPLDPSIKLSKSVIFVLIVLHLALQRSSAKCHSAQSLSWHQQQLAGGVMEELELQELQDERHPHKRKPDGGIDGWMSREESLSHPLSQSSSHSVSFCGDSNLYPKVTKALVNTGNARGDQILSTLFTSDQVCRIVGFGKVQKISLVGKSLTLMTANSNTRLQLYKAKNSLVLLLTQSSHSLYKHGHDKLRDFEFEYEFMDSGRQSVPVSSRSDHFKDEKNKKEEHLQRFPGCSLEKKKELTNTLMVTKWRHISVLSSVPFMIALAALSVSLARSVSVKDNISGKDLWRGERRH